jgi:D-arginine dehydrogenase
MRVDIAIIGAGMAGASLASELAPHARVVMIEAESHPGYHATGRSAAFWSETYGGPLVQPLTTASGAFLARPPAAFSDTGFLKPRGALHVATAQGRVALDQIERDFTASVSLERWARRAIEAAVPGIRPAWQSAVMEGSCCDIDVAGLHAAYLRTARRTGAELLTDSRVDAIERAQRWRISTRAGTIEADLLVNAAGAWASPVAALAGGVDIRVTPMRRTMVQLEIDPPAAADMPLVLDAGGRFYFKPEAGGRLWLTPHDETPTAPCDSAPEELDIATAIDRLERVVNWRVVRVERSWAGLRSFAPDRAPIYGFDPVAPGLFWFAGQGGFGIQTAPAAAKLAAAILLGRPPEAMVAGIDPSHYAPSRFLGPTNRSPA